MLTSRTTLAQFLIEERQRHPASSGDLNSLILQAALACKAISVRVAQGELGGVLGATEVVNAHGEVQKKLEMLAHDYFIRATEWGGQVAAISSGECAEPYLLPVQYPRGEYLLIFDPLDGSSNISEPRSR